MSGLDGLPPLRDVIRAHGLSARKSLGQNFLLDLNLTAKIARAGGPLEGVTVIEVGAGPGGLTRALLAAGARRVVAIERDARCLAALAEIAAHYPGRLDVVEADARTVDMAALAETPCRVVANLPYNIATPLLVGWVAADPWPPWYQSLTLMFQREVAERMVAGPGDRNYGRLGVLCGWRMRAQILFDIPARAFSPPPRVTSSVVRLEPRHAPLPASVRQVERITAAAFGQRRKMLRSSLRRLFAAPEATIRAAGIDPQRRAEEIDIAGFVALANALDDEG